MKKMILMAVMATAVMASSCSKNDATDATSKDPVQLQFKGGMELTTKADAFIFSGVKANIYVYASGADLSSAEATNTEVYTAGEAGTLTGKAITVTPNPYDFYSVSENSTNAPVSFTNGSATVINDKDYLWTKVNKAISATDKQIAFSYSHSAAKINIIVAGSSSITLTEAKTFIKLTPADATGATMSLATGKISTASAVGSLTSMRMGGNMGTYIMVPMANVNMSVELTANIKIGEAEAVDKTYTATITAPSKGFEAGKLYTYTATISGEECTFTGATVKPWETGANESLTPEEKPEV